MTAIQTHQPTPKVKIGQGAKKNSNPVLVSNPVSAVPDVFIQRKPRCACGGGCPKCQAKESGIQTKLTIGAPNDKYEQEADRVADQVMEMQESDQIQPKQISPLIQTKKTANKTPELTPKINSSIQSLQGGGQPLSRSERRFFEPRFGKDFSNVRVHTDSRAARVAESVNARAFTLGHNVVFGTGEFSTKELSGRKLLAHELTHVMQQGAARNYNSAPVVPNFTQAENTNQLQRASFDVGRIRINVDYGNVFATPESEYVSKIEAMYLSWTGVANAKEIHKSLIALTVDKQKWVMLGLDLLMDNTNSPEFNALDRKEAVRRLIVHAPKNKTSFASPLPEMEKEVLKMSGWHAMAFSSPLLQGITLTSPGDDIPHEPEATGPFPTKAVILESWLDNMCPDGNWEVNKTTGVVDTPDRNTFCGITPVNGHVHHTTSSHPTSCGCLCDIAVAGSLNIEIRFGENITNDGISYPLSTGAGVLDVNETYKIAGFTGREAAYFTGVGATTPQSGVGRAQKIKSPPWVVFSHEVCGHVRLDNFENVMHSTTSQGDRTAVDIGNRVRRELSTVTNSLGLRRGAFKANNAVGELTDYIGAVYQVNSGETLIGIAVRCGVPIGSILKHIWRFNGDRITRVTQHRIRSGEDLLIEGIDWHDVIHGEDMPTIATMWAIPLASLKRANPQITAPLFTIQPGNRLLIPMR